jgi:hypothetical protein
VKNITNKQPGGAGKNLRRLFALFSKNIRFCPKNGQNSEKYTFSN